MIADENEVKKLIGQKNKVQMRAIVVSNLYRIYWQGIVNKSEGGGISIKNYLVIMLSFEPDQQK